jgi:hypothetical protein
MSTVSTGDEVLDRRARAARIASTGQRLGYLAFLTAIVVFAVGLATTFTDVVATALGVPDPLCWPRPSSSTML